MLNGKQRHQLRGLAHHLNPVVQVGQQGVTDAVVAAAEQALFDHELVKVKIAEGPQDRHEAADSLAEKTGAELVQLLGRVAVLFKQRPEKSRFEVKAQSVQRKEPSKDKAQPGGPGKKPKGRGR